MNYFLLAQNSCNLELEQEHELDQGPENGEKLAPAVNLGWLDKNCRAGTATRPGSKALA